MIIFYIRGYIIGIKGGQYRFSRKEKVMAEEVEAAADLKEKETIIKVSAPAKAQFDQFKAARNLSQPKAFDEIIGMLETLGFVDAHPGHEEAFKAIDSLTQKLRATVEGVIVAGEESAEKAKVAAAREIEAYRAQADAAVARVEELEKEAAKIPGYREAVAKAEEERERDLETLKDKQARIDELEGERAEIKEIENQAKDDQAARAQAERALAIAEKDKAKAEAEAAKAKAELDAFKEKAEAEAKLAAAKAEAELNAALREAEVARASAEKDVAVAKETAAKAEGRADALAADVARIRDERNQARAALAAARAEVKAKEEQIAMLERLLNIAGGAAQGEDGEEE